MTHRSKRILIIDTRDEWLSFARSTLSEAGYEVEVARNIREANEILFDKNSNFDLILADQKVAEAEAERGILRNMIGREPDRQRRVVVVSPAQPTVDKMRTIFKLGAFDYVDKQYETVKLVDLVQEIFENPYF